MANFVKHEPCPSCNSKDNLARYDDDSAYCFGCEYYEGDKEFFEQHLGKEKSLNTIIGETKHLAKRKISLETCRKYNYRVGVVNNKQCHIMDY